MDRIYYEPLSNIRICDEINSTGTYRIYNRIENKSYVGVSMTRSFWDRLFEGKFCHKYLIDNDQYGWHSKLRNYPLSEIYFEILSIGCDKEEEFIKLYDSYYNGYNNTLTGKPERSHLGKKCVTNGLVDLFIKDFEVNQFLDKHSDFRLGSRIDRSHDAFTTLNLISVTDGESNRMISSDEVNAFLSSNPTYRKGCTGSFNGSKGQIWITDGINSIRIYPEDIDKYPNYRRGRKM